jgi:hypothetical protein
MCIIIVEKKELSKIESMEYQIHSLGHKFTSFVTYKQKIAECTKYSHKKSRIKRNHSALNDTQVN